MTKSIDSKVVGVNHRIMNLELHKLKSKFKSKESGIERMSQRELENLV